MWDQFSQSHAEFGERVDIGCVEPFEIQEQVMPDDSDWTGAEIRACCRLAALLNLSLVQASRNIVPVAVTAQESVKRLRQWASGRCLCAESGGLYGISSTGKHNSSKLRPSIPPDPRIN